MLNILTVKLEGFREISRFEIRTVGIVQHVYKRRLDTTFKRERESCRMATTTTDKGKGLERPKFSGKDEDYQVWITKFEAYAKVKGFYMVMAGTDVLPPANQATKTAPELKVEEKNDTGYCTMLLAMDSAGKAFTIVALAKTMELPAGCVRRHQEDVRA